MFSRVRIAIRFFFVGLAVGVLLAPRSGEETRRLVREKADRLLNDVLDAATLGTANTGGRTNGASTSASTSTSSTAGDEESAPKQTRSRSRSRETETSSAGT